MIKISMMHMMIRRLATDTSAQEFAYRPAGKMAA